MDMAEFIKNAWYAACWSAELTDSPMAKRVLCQDVALFRTEKGVAGAVEDRCPHRFAPLSLGKVCGENIVCGYHGMQFDCEGNCTSIPGQKNIPSRVRARAYPVVEKYDLIWLWTGDLEKTDPDLVPDVHWITDPDWCSVTGTARYDCNWLLLVDNLIDLSHTTFVHQSTIGTDDVADTPVIAERKGDIVTVTREMKNTEPSKFYKRLRTFSGRVDRWQKIWLEPPSAVIIDAGAVPTGTSDKTRGVDTRVISILKPVDERSVDQLWAFSRDFALDDEKLNVEIEKSLIHTFGEDMAFLAGQQRNLERFPTDKMLNNSADAGVVLTRRVIDEYLAAD